MQLLKSRNSHEIDSVLPEGQSRLYCWSLCSTRLSSACQDSATLITKIKKLIISLCSLECPTPLPRVSLRFLDTRHHQNYTAVSSQADWFWAVSNTRIQAGFWDLFYIRASGKSSFFKINSKWLPCHKKTCLGISSSQNVRQSLQYVGKCKTPLWVIQEIK